MRNFQNFPRLVGTMHIKSSGFWVINYNAALRSYISKCVTWRHIRGNFQQQKMASLPSNRLCKEPPFTYGGADPFEPFVTQEGSKELKHFGVLFTYLSIRAIHIEKVTSSLNTELFILCLWRFCWSQTQRKHHTSKTR